MSDHIKLANLYISIISMKRYEQKQQFWMPMESMFFSEIEEGGERCEEMTFWLPQ